MRESSTQNSPLPPSVEKAYHQKCIDMKKRLADVEETNDAARLRVLRIERAITKMRIERAILLDALAKKQQHTGKDEASDASESEPPSPREHGPPVKRKRTSAPNSDRNASASLPSNSNHAQYSPGTSAATAAAPYHSFSGPSVSYPNPPNYASGSTPTSSNARHSSNPTLIHPTTPYLAPGPSPNPPPPPKPSTTTASSASNNYSQPQIHDLPNGTSVMLVAPNQPKKGPWVISELDPRHHFKTKFESMDLDEQEVSIFGEDYLPFDRYGKAIRVIYYPAPVTDDSPPGKLGRYRHIFPHEEAWTNPVVNSIRRDSAEFREPVGERARRLYRRDGPIARPGGIGAGPAAGPAAGMIGLGFLGPPHQTDGAADDEGPDRRSQQQSRLTQPANSQAGFTAANR